LASHSTQPPIPNPRLSDSLQSSPRYTHSTSTSVSLVVLGSMSCYSPSCRYSALGKVAVLPSTPETLRYLSCHSPACRKKNEERRERVTLYLERRKQLLQLQQKGSMPLIVSRRRSSAASNPSSRTGSQFNLNPARQSSSSMIAPALSRLSSAVPAISEEPKRNGIPASSFLCYSPGSQCCSNKRCYSPRCRYFTSYWRCRSIRRMLARVKICCSLRCQSVSPFASFVPRALHGYLRELTSSTHFEEVPSGSSQEAAILFADASGFTALTERLSKHVRTGKPALSSSLNGNVEILISQTSRIVISRPALYI
jgi:hypothetical protein